MKIFTHALYLIAAATMASCGNKENAACCMDNDSIDEASEITEGPCGTNDAPQTGEEVWKKVSDWKKYIPWSTFGTFEAYTCYDIDSDGVPEAIVRGNDEGTIHYSILTCSKEGGGLGDIDDVEQVVNNIEASMFGIIKDQPFVFIKASTSDGDEYEQYHLFENSYRTNFYTMLMRTKNDETTYEYTKFTDTITKEEYHKAVPKMIADVVDMETLDWMPISK